MISVLPPRTTTLINPSAFTTVQSSQRTQCALGEPAFGLSPEDSHVTVLKQKLESHREAEPRREIGIGDPPAHDRSSRISTSLSELISRR
jgi:hypothetical protein